MSDNLTETLEESLKNTQDELKALKDKQTSVSGEIQRRDVSLEETQQQLYKAENELQALRTKCKQQSDELTTKETQYNSVLRELEAIDDERNNAEELAESYKKKVDELSSQHANLNSQLERLNEQYMALKKKYSKKCDEASKDSSYLREQIRELENRIGEYEDIGRNEHSDEPTNDTDPEAKHPLDQKIEEDRHKSGKHTSNDGKTATGSRSQWLSKFAELQCKCSALEEELRSKETHYQKKLRESEECRQQAESALQHIQAEKASWEKKFSTLEQEILSLKEKYSKLREQLHESEHFNHVSQQKIKSLEQEVSTEKQQNQSLQWKCSSLEGTMKNLEQEKHAALETIENLRETLQQCRAKSPTEEKIKSFNGSRDGYVVSERKVEIQDQRPNEEVGYMENTQKQSTHEELVSCCRQKDGEIRSLRADLENLRARNIQLEDQILGSSKDVEQCQKSSEGPDTFSDYYALQSRYYAALELLGEREEELELREEELQHVKTQFQRQVDQLCPPIENTETGSGPA